MNSLSTTTSTCAACCRGGSEIAPTSTSHRGRQSGRLRPHLCETSGIGQGSDAITTVADHSLYVMTATRGDTPTREVETTADVVILNKYEKRGGKTPCEPFASRCDVPQHVRRGRRGTPSSPPSSQFADGGVDRLGEGRCYAVGFRPSSYDAMGERKVIPPTQPYWKLPPRCGTTTPPPSSPRSSLAHLETAAGQAEARSKPRRKTKRAQIGEHGGLDEAKDAANSCLAEEYASGEYITTRKPFKVKPIKSLAHLTFFGKGRPKPRTTASCTPSSPRKRPRHLHRRCLPVQAHRRVVGPHVRR